MCLAIPGRIARIEGDVGFAEFGGAERRVGLMLVPGARVGDWVLVHAGYAIQTLDEEEALESLRLFEELLADEPGAAGAP
ncbi:MAG: HypC/HybG/HupF family hydrogenase formation chaperone [Deltaproteobacteria bacterium]|nr:HypC/HybG/HupF family hydrogenase formation chaperone [Deltaproteobacteria bacterium]